MKIAREGFPFALFGLFLAGSSWTIFALGYVGVLGQGAAIVFTALAVFVLWFFRDPEPDAPSDPRAVVAPGQGKVTDILEIDEPSYLGGIARRITIFLNVFDVHVQRAPVCGAVEYFDYRPGLYLVAWKEKASSDNEQACLGISTPDGKVLVKQIAGLIARRIITDPSVGDRVDRGSRIGLIRFGSRVDLFVPLDWAVTCSVGDRVTVGSTVLARRPEEKSPA